MYKIKLFETTHLHELESTINNFIETGRITDWEMVGSVSVKGESKSFKHIVAIRYWTGNNR